MERLELKLQAAIKALKSLGEILKEPYSDHVRDASIKRFEYSFETFYKLVKEYIKEKEGGVCNFPKSCFKEVFSANLCSEEETISLLKMTDDRNETVHTYKEEKIKEIYSRIKGYYELMDSILQRVIKNL